MYVTPSTSRWVTPASKTALFIVAAALLLSSCAALRPPDTVATGPGRNAWYAQRAVLAFEAVVDGAVGLNKLQLCTGETLPQQCRPTLSDTNLRIVLDVSRRTVVVLGKTPDGWRAATAQGLTELRTKLDSSGRSQLGQWLAFAEAILKE